MAVPTEVFEFDGIQYVTKDAYDQQFADNQALRTRNEQLLGQPDTLKTTVRGFSTQVAGLVGLEAPQAAPQRRAAQQGTAGQQQAWLLQTVSGVAVRDDLRPGTEQVQVQRIMCKQQQQDGITADTQLLFRPYDAVQLASHHSAWTGAEEQFKRLTKLVSCTVVWEVQDRLACGRVQ